MAVQDHVRNPLEWAWDHLKQTGHAVEATAHTMEGTWEDHDVAPPSVRRIGAADIGDALAQGLKDFAACRTDVVFLCLIYPVAGLVISRMAFDHGMVALIFPLVAGFALIAPLFGVGLYEMSRRRECGLETGWTDAFGVVRAPAIGAILVLGLLLLALFCLWLFAAYFLYTVTLGPDAPVSAAAPRQVGWWENSGSSSQAWDSASIAASSGQAINSGVSPVFDRGTTRASSSAHT